MHIVIPGALPEPETARALLPHLEKTAPTLVAWFSHGRAKRQAADPATAGCTAYEQWVVQQAGFRPDPQQIPGTALGPLWSQNQNVEPGQPIWLAELVHMAPTQSSTALLGSNELNITQDQSVALFESAQTLFEGTGFQLHPDSNTRWRIVPPDGFEFRSASPALVSTSSVNDWWPQDQASRPWRRLFNEIQMLWFGHPVNQARKAQGERAINGLWLFGGARMEQLQTLALPDTVQHYLALQAPFMAQDWGGWLAALGQLEDQVFGPLARQGRQPKLVLTGGQEIITLEPSSLARWSRWLPGSQKKWSHWWLYRN